MWSVYFLVGYSSWILITVGTQTPGKMCSSYWELTLKNKDVLGENEGVHRREKSRLFLMDLLSLLDIAGSE